MRKLFILLLIALTNQVFSQLPGSFFLFDQDPHLIGSLPYFYQTDNPLQPTLDYFYPSILKMYNDNNNQFTFGIGIQNQFPDAKFEINAAPTGIGIGQTMYPALKVYGGSIGLDVQGASKGIYLHDDDVNNIGYGIYQIGKENLKNYFSNRIGIGLEEPVKMVDIAGDFRCTGPGEIGTGISLKSTNITVPYPIYSNGQSVQFEFPYVTPSDPGQGGPFSLLTLTANAIMDQVEVAGTTKTIELNVTDLTNTLALNVGNQTTTKTFQMTTDPGLNKVMMSDLTGKGSWTDFTPWLNMFWSFSTNNNNIFSHGRNVGIGTGLDDDSYYDVNRFTVLNPAFPVSIFANNTSPTSLNRIGISSNLKDPAGDISGVGGDVNAAIQPGQGGASILSVGISSILNTKATGIGLIGISSEVTDNGATSIPVYGIKSLIDGSENTNQKYGLYSEISGGTPNNRWAGYFKGGDVEINYGSLIIGKSEDKRFCIQTQYWNDGTHTLYIIPNGGKTTWDCSKALALSDSGTLYVSGKIYAREIEVTLDNYIIPDYVFAPDYKILPLNELEKFVKTNQHLPEVPSAEEMKANGTNLGEMNVKLLKKVEELTLYVIELKKEVDELKKERN